MPQVKTPSEPRLYLFEQTAYTLLLQSRTGEPVTLHHTDPVLLRGLARAEDGCILHGPLNFGSQVGYSRFVVGLGERSLFAFVVEVFPSKLDYQNDCEALLSDLQSIARALVLDHFRATYRRGAQNEESVAEDVEWLLLLRHFADDLEQAIDYIAEHSQWGTERHTARTRTHRIRKPDSAVRNAMQREQHHRMLAQVVSATGSHEHLPAIRTRYTLDTAAHRWLGYHIRQISRQLSQMHASEARYADTMRRQHLLEALEVLRQRMVRLASILPFQASRTVPPSAPPQALLNAPGYREAYQACLRMRQGLRLGGEPLELGLKDLHLIYEYWCFLTLVRLLSERSGQPLPVRDLVSTERYGLQLRLRKGRAQTVQFSSQSGGCIELVYNPRFGGEEYLVPQQPDFLLTVFPDDGLPRRFVLDAKYRLDASASYQARYGIPGPPADALNDLHRYRDAIRDVAYQRTVEQAIALYPWREEEARAYASSRHAYAVQHLGVGAIPLLPDSTDALKAWLETVLSR